MLVHVKSHNHDLNSNLKINKNEDTIASPLSLFSNISCSTALVQSACNRNEVFCQLFSAFLVYQARKKDSQNESKKEHSNLFNEQGIYHLFPYKVHRLSCYHNLPAVITD